MVRGLAVHPDLRACSEREPLRRRILLDALQSIEQLDLQRATPYFWTHLRAVYGALAARRIDDIGRRLDRLSLAAIDSFAASPVFRWEGRLGAPALSAFQAPRLGLRGRSSAVMNAMYWRSSALCVAFDDGHEETSDIASWKEDVACAAVGPTCMAIDASEVDIGDNAENLEKSDAALRLFAAQLAQAWTCVASTSPEVAALVCAETSHVVPLRLAARHLSFSLSQLPGVIFVGAGTTLWPVSEAIVHESAHLRLNHAAEVLPLTVGQRRAICYSPWRDDPRPADGVIHGAYAFMLVLGFWLRALEAPAANLDEHGRAYAVARCSELCVQLGDALDVLERCELAPPGAMILQRLREVLPDDARIPVSHADLAHARQVVGRHRQRALATYPGLIAPAARHAAAA